MTSKFYLLNAWSMVYQIRVYYGCECSLNTLEKNSIQPSVDSYTNAISMTIFIIIYIVAVFLFLGFVMNKLKRRIRCCFLSQIDLKRNKLLFLQWLCPLWQVQTSNWKLPLMGLECLMDACTCMKHGHPSYVHIVLQMSED